MPNRPRHVVLCDIDEFWVHDCEFWVYDRENWLDESVDVVMLEYPPGARMNNSFCDLNGAVP